MVPVLLNPVHLLDSLMITVDSHLLVPRLIFPRPTTRLPVTPLVLLLLVRSTTLAIVDTTPTIVAVTTEDPPQGNDRLDLDPALSKSNAPAQRLRNFTHQTFSLVHHSANGSGSANYSRNSAPSIPISSGSRIGSWKRGGTRVSNFDVRPADGIDLPPVGVVPSTAGVPNSYFSYANNPALGGAPLPGLGAAAGGSKYGATPYGQPKVSKMCFIVAARV